MRHPHAFEEFAVPAVRFPVRPAVGRVAAVVAATALAITPTFAAQSQPASAPA